MCKARNARTLETGQWVKVKARIEYEFCVDYEGEGPVLYVTGVKPCQKPDPENVSF